MRKSKNRYFYHIFVSLGDAPGAITLNVVWMEREFDAYKLSRCMCSSNYNRFWQSEIFVKKIVILSYPRAFDAPVRGVQSEYRHPVRYGKTGMVGLPDGEKIENICNGLGTIPACDRQTDRQTDRRTAYTRYAFASRGKNVGCGTWKRRFFTLAVRITGKLLKIDG